MTEFEPTWMSENAACALGDSLTVMQSMADASVDQIITDPPYGLKFMGRAWDHGVPSAEVWAEALRIAKPGAMLLAFGGTRTYHRLAVAIEDAGWEIRDCMMWLYGSGFPKSMDISKAIDKAGGVSASAFKLDLKSKVDASGMSRSKIDTECGFTMRFDTPYEADPVGWGVSLPSPEKWQKICEVLEIDPASWQGLIDRVWRGRAGDVTSTNGSMSGGNYQRNTKEPAVIDDAKVWNGYGTALKPAWEPIIVAMKPLDGTFVNNALTHGVAGLNIDACRVGNEARTWKGMSARQPECAGTFRDDNWVPKEISNSAEGRWPANVILDEDAGAVLDEQSGTLKSGKPGIMRCGENTGTALGKESRKPGTPMKGIGDSGGASRFFYCAKASKAEKTCKGAVENKHPTVKPLALMRYLCRLLKMPGDEGTLIFDPFMGSGSTGVAALQEGCYFLGLDNDEPSFQTAVSRIEAEEANK